MEHKQLTLIDIETIYDQLADALDQAAQGKRELFLVKLALLSAHALGDAEQFMALTRTALLDL
ncbi:DUF2783 domain-containing protein [Pseudomonas defluvii]|uniref:DUF2783 domain-containing protein n=1 Tax=Pseudomonas TaxID=286 RepID=UPI0009F34BE0|nr:MULTISPECIES: DUF2783 domain-containing protein [Pseudomonas]MEE3636751.1 DUF2783 domain-containing protein [Pseudomonas sp. AL 58]WJM95798.1 DUF2783 domain-containing protein [Pseudomonas defluvii]